MDGARSVAIAGATGYVGRRLIDRLLAADVSVVAFARRTDALVRRPGLDVRAVDVSDTAAVTEELAGVSAAYYLVHSMAGGVDFAARDRELAQSFADAAARARLERIVYVGGLGEGELSAHLDSRHEVGRILGSTGVPLVELRAAVVLGAGSISFEMLRYLTERLPVMVCPRWVSTRLQPIAERDLLSYLEQSLDVAPGVYEIGGPEVTTYREMIATYAQVRGLRKRRIVPVPLLTPSLSSHWVDAVTPVDRTVSHQLIESLTNEVVVRQGERTRAAFSVDCLGPAEAIRAALDEQAARVPASVLGLADGLRDGIYAMRSGFRLEPEDVFEARRDLAAGGGDLRWYGLANAWRLRLLLGRAFGERLAVRRGGDVVPGARLDWWTVEVKTDDELVLGTTQWFCGEAWLGLRIHDGPVARLEQVGALRTKGVVGFIYWRVLWPVHRVVFGRMARQRVGRIRRQPTGDQVPTAT